MSDVVNLPSKPRASEGSLVEQTRAAAEVAAAVRVALEFPRDIDSAVSGMQQSMGSLTVAQRAFYEVPNRGAGGSVHLARELARVWRNLDYGVRELRRDDAAGESEMQAWAWDQENNVRSSRSFLVPHAKDTKAGRKKLDDLADIYLNNQNIGARAVRECIFAIIPDWFIEDAKARARETIKSGGGVPLADRIKQSVTWFHSMKVNLAQLETRVGRPSSKWTEDDLADLARVGFSIGDGIPAVEFFPDEKISVAELATAADEGAPDPADPEYQAFLDRQATE
jgi:hypothetical protein